MKEYTYEVEHSWEKQQQRRAPPAPPLDGIDHQHHRSRHSHHRSNVGEDAAMDADASSMSGKSNKRNILVDVIYFEFNYQWIKREQSVYFLALVLFSFNIYFDWTWNSMTNLLQWDLSDHEPIQVDVEDIDRRTKNEQESKQKKLRRSSTSSSIIVGLLLYDE